ncbi:hypothetical protein [Deinococcus sp. PESE-13]
MPENSGREGAGQQGGIPVKIRIRPRRCNDDMRQMVVLGMAQTQDRPQQTTQPLTPPFRRRVGDRIG